MRILSITAGAADMYCGSCLRDNALAAELLARGHQVTLLPLYTPTLTDEPNVSTHDRVLFGGVSVYLEQHLGLFRYTPRWLDRLWDSPAALRLLARQSLKTDPRMLGALTVSMLKGENGRQRKEFEKMKEWLQSEPSPDVVNLPNSLLIALARPLRQVLNRPVCCTLQGEDLFIEGLPDSYRAQALDLIRSQLDQVDLFIAVSDFYQDRMSEYLRIGRERIAVVPLGISVSDYDAQPRRENAVFTIGYFARIAPEKGLHELCEAYRVLRQEFGVDARLEVAGYLAREHRPYLARLQEVMRGLGFAGEFRYHGELSRDEKIGFLRSVDVLSVPGPFPDPKGMYLLEAMAAGTPVVQPRRGAYPEVIGMTGGGILVDEGPRALAEGLLHLHRDTSLRLRLGATGAEGVRAHYAVAQSAGRLLDVYERLLNREPAAAQLTRVG
jgi:glycosyltransferase involved in cell wall biosynthesis